MSNPLQGKVTPSEFSAYKAENVQQFSEVDADILALQTDKADKTEVNSLATAKADKTYVDTQIASVASGSPKGIYATLADLQTAFPTGNTNIYVVTADGKWYYWNGSAWTAGGTYQSTGISAKAVSFSKLASSIQNIMAIDDSITHTDFTMGYSLDGTGTEIVATNKYLLSPFISPFADKITLTDVTHISTYLIAQVFYYDELQAFISSSGWNVVSNSEIILNDAINYGFIRIVLLTSTTTSISNIVYWHLGDTALHTFTLNFKKLISNADNDNYGYVKPDGDTVYIENGLLKSKQQSYIPYGNLITIAKSGGMYATIQEAVQHYSNADAVALIYPGTYTEQINTQDDTYGNKGFVKYLTGVDKDKCRVVWHNNAYGQDTLWVGKAYVKNLSFISDTEGIAGATTCAYALHLDNNWLVNTKVEFDNCYFYSQLRAAVGIGTRPGCDIVFRDCIFETESIMGSGAVFFHNSNDAGNLGTNQRLTFINCQFKSKYGAAIYVQRVGDDTNVIELTVSGCTFYSEETGITSPITVDDSLYTGISGNNIHITVKTFGNNINISDYIHA